MLGNRKRLNRKKRREKKRRVRKRGIDRKKGWYNNGSSDKK